MLRVRGARAVGGSRATGIVRARPERGTGMQPGACRPAVILRRAAGGAVGPGRQLLARLRRPARARRAPRRET